MERESAYELHARKVREKDRDLRNLKRGELQLKVAQDSHSRVLQNYEKVQLQVRPVINHVNDTTSKKACQR